jgi:NAD(P)-dependent dehydrogenase (short-subunit alcohol dehydrogenase family)
MTQMAGQVVVITGASGNLGRALAAAFAARNAQLVLVDRQRDRLDATYGAEDARRIHVTADLLNAEAVEAAARATMDRFGRVDALCNIAGGFRMGSPVHETKDADWSFLFDINARTVLHAARAFVPRMLAGGGGKIVNVGAFAAQKGAADMGAYVASKGAVIRLTEAMSAELRDRNVNVNCVLPTIIDTPENRKAMPGADPRKWVAPEELANVIIFLASDAARAIHGAAIPVTGLS